MENKDLQSQNAHSDSSEGMESLSPGTSMSPPAFQLQANPIQPSFGNAPIQRAPIETDWGKFIDTDYNLIEDDSRLMADFHFEPGEKVDATKIQGVV